jgi:hypothetical protein
MAEEDESARSISLWLEGIQKKFPSLNVFARLQRWTLARKEGVRLPEGGGFGNIRTSI